VALSPNCSSVFSDSNLDVDSFKESESFLLPPGKYIAENLNEKHEVKITNTKNVFLAL